MSSVGSFVGVERLNASDDRYWKLDEGVARSSDSGGDERRGAVSAGLSAGFACSGLGAGGFVSVVSIAQLCRRGKPSTRMSARFAIMYRPIAQSSSTSGCLCCILKWHSVHTETERRCARCFSGSVKTWTPSEGFSKLSSF